MIIDLAGEEEEVELECSEQNVVISYLNKVFLCWLQQWR